MHGWQQTMRCLGLGFWLCPSLWLGLWLCLPCVAFAQAELRDPGSVRVAPKLLEMPEIVLPPVPEGEASTPPIEVVEATILVSVDGLATLEESDAPPDVAAVIAEALSRARFNPATVDGAEVVARVRIRLRVTTAPPPVPEPAPQQAPATDVVDPIGDAPTEVAVEEPPVSSYQATARTKPVPPTARHLEIAEMRDVPGAFGDPFRVLDTLPGVIPIFSGLPYVYVRGAPPASTSYVYDDIAVPLLFHFGVLAAIVHPAMLGDLMFYASVAPARFGRKTGGVFGAQGPEFSEDKLHGEVELRLIDVSTMLHVPIAGGGRVVAAARYGYPGAIASLLVEDFTLSYWDYQLRAEIPVGNHDRFELVWFGSYDKAGEPGDEITITFHRVETRLLHEVGKLQLGAALQLGFDQTSAGNDFHVQSARFGPRIWATWNPNPRVKLRVGGDMLATAGEIGTNDSNSDGEPPVGMPDPGQPMPGEPNPPDEPGGRGPDDRVDPISQQVKGRNMVGLYAELNLHPVAQWEFALGVRGDLWMTGTTQQHAAEPRVTLTYHPTDVSDVYVAGGVAYQPAVFPIPIPGLADIVLDNGLQRALQVEGGYRRDFGDELRLETGLFFSHYSGLLFLSTAFDCDSDDGSGEGSDACDGDGFPRSTSDAYGWEVFLKRPSHHTVSGWISYTLGGATATGPTGRSFIPETDVRHFGSIVLQFDLGKNWKFGTRGFFRTGRVATFESTPFNPDQRLPGFARADVMISNRWKTSWGHMKLSLEWFNLTFAREATGLNCFQDDTGLAVSCKTEYAPAIAFPNLGLRGEF